MREQSRAYNSLVMTSDDEGQTWSECRETAASVTGDRHNLCYAPDGRLVTVLASPTKFNFVAWVGTYDNLLNSRNGEYRVLLRRHHKTFHPTSMGTAATQAWRFLQTEHSLPPPILSTSRARRTQ